MSLKKPSFLSLKKRTLKRSLNKNFAEYECFIKALHNSPNYKFSSVQKFQWMLNWFFILFIYFFLRKYFYETSFSAFKRYLIVSKVITTIDIPSMSESQRFMKTIVQSHAQQHHHFFQCWLQIWRTKQIFFLFKCFSKFN
jgi:hypothetical protein